MSLSFEKELDNRRLIRSMSADAVPKELNLHASDHDGSDEFLKAQPTPGMTGRQRKRVAARSKGGEFIAQRKKRRIYFACVSSEIDVQDMLDYLTGSGGSFQNWSFKLFDHVLWLFKHGDREESNYVDISVTHDFYSISSAEIPTLGRGISAPLVSGDSVSVDQYKLSADGAKEVFVFDFGSIVMWGFSKVEEANMLKTIRMFATKGVVAEAEFECGEDDMAFVIADESVISNTAIPISENPFVALSAPKEAIDGNCSSDDDFGDLESSVERYNPKNVLDGSRINGNLDETRYAPAAPSVQSPIKRQGSVKKALECRILVANDLITLSSDSTPKERLSASFAIAQSSLLSVFESRVHKKILDYEFVPQALANYGEIHISQRTVGIMSGEIFAIGHDLNLHSELLDVPDFFWSEEKKFGDTYKMVHEYLEVSRRHEILNKRLSLLSELIDVVSQKIHSSHGALLEWIIIWLIVISVVLDMMGGLPM